MIKALSKVNLAGRFRLHIHVRPVQTIDPTAQISGLVRTDCGVLMVARLLLVVLLEHARRRIRGHWELLAASVYASQPVCQHFCVVSIQARYLAACSLFTFGSYSRLAVVGRSGSFRLASLFAVGVLLAVVSLGLHVLRVLLHLEHAC